MSIAQNQYPWSEVEEKFLCNIENKLKSMLSEMAVIEPLRSAVSYALFPAGKRVRPLLALFLCHDLGGDIEPLLTPAAAIEILHCASLIHDDLPALDNDDFRRGRAACHKAFPEATAVLAGDVMVPYALHALTKSAYNDIQKVELVKILSRSFVDLCYGQQLDLGVNQQDDNIHLRHKLKTGALFRACAEIAALAAKVTPQCYQNAIDLGNAIGVHFQALDDYVDIGGAKEENRPILDQSYRELERQLTKLSTSAAVELLATRYFLEKLFSQFKAK